MRSVSAAKVGGCLSSLYPEGANIQSLPNDLHIAIDQSLRILSWQENLSGKEMPPRWMWHLDWEIERHFEKVDRDRESKYGSTSSDSGDGSEGDSDAWDENVYASRFK